MPSSGLILDPLNQSGASGSIYDRFGNVGTLSNVTPERIESDIWGLKFNGSNSNINFGTRLYGAIIDKLTILQWCKPLNKAGTANMVMTSRGYPVYELLLLYDLSGIRLYKYKVAAPGYDSINLVFTSAALPSYWTMIGITMDGTAITGYKDGLAFDTGVSTDVSIVDNPGISLVLGDRSGGIGDRPFNGWLQPPSMFNCVLSAGEIMGYYNAMKGYYR